MVKQQFVDWIKRERESLEHDCSTSTTDTHDTITRARFDFVNNKDIVKLINYKSIYIDSARSFVKQVKYQANCLTKQEEHDLLLLAIQCIDLTTLSGDDTPSNVERLCLKATRAYIEQSNQEVHHLKCAAVCVYPARVRDCINALRDKFGDNDVNIASVATGFPSGQCGLKSRLAEITYAVESGANEIDVVINRTAAIQSDWITVFQELCEMRRVCNSRLDEDHEVHMKVIIGAGDLLTCSPNTIYMASLVSILAGADFIKTSTGKESVNATLSISYIMMRAIVDYYETTGIRIGFKPAGGIKTHKSALEWLLMARMMLGKEWLNKDLFRFGASGLLDDIIKRIDFIKSQ